MLQTLLVSLPFFALIACGLLAGGLKLLPAEAARGLTLYVFSFALPALLFHSLATRPLADVIDLPFMLLYGGTVLCVFAIGAWIGKRWFDADIAAMGLHGQAAAVGNLGFMGLPLIAAILGEAARIPMILALTIDLLLVIPLALILIQAGLRSADATARWRQGLGVLKGTILNPFVLSIGAGVLWAAASPIALPGAIDRFLVLLGGTAGPVALFALGLSLVGRPIAEGFSECLAMSAAKLLISPLLMALVMIPLYLWLLGGDPLTAKAAILVAALPIAGNLFIIAQQYGIRVARASTAVLLSTALAILTLSAIASGLLALPP